MPAFLDPNDDYVTLKIEALDDEVLPSFMSYSDRSK